MDHSLDIDGILIRYIKEEELSPEETAFLQEWLQSGEGREEMIRQFKNETEWVEEGLKKMQHIPHSRIWDNFSSRLEQEGHWPSSEDSVSAPVIPLTYQASRSRWRILAAATVFFAVAGTAFWTMQRRTPAPANAVVQPPDRKSVV